MNDQGPPAKRVSQRLSANAPGGTQPLGAGLHEEHLKGVSPAVVNAFLSGRPGGTPAPSDDGSGLLTPPTESLTLPRTGDDLGDFKMDASTDSVKAKFNRIKALAAAARQEDRPALPEAGAGTQPLGTGNLDPLARQLLEAREKGARKTGGLDQPETKLQHLAMRAKQQKAAGTHKLDKLEKSVAAALGEQGALRLRHSLKALEDKALPGKLSALAAQINGLLPEGSEHYLKLGSEVGKQVVLNNVNPVVAISMAVKESHERLEKLKEWEKLTQREKVANVALLSSNMAEILGAVTPPPVNFGVQVLGAGMLLVGLASEHSEVVEDVARVSGASKVAEAGQHIATRVKGAWEELNGRLAARKRPRLPRQIQSVLDSPSWKSLKRYALGRTFTEGVENVLYNLARRQEALTAYWLDRLKKFRKGKSR